MDIVCDSVETAEEGSSESDITNCSDGSLSSQSDNRTESDVTSGGKTQYTLLDLYSGCGGMSTGLCMGASLSSVKLVTVDMYFEILDHVWVSIPIKSTFSSMCIVYAGHILLSSSSGK